MADVNSFPLTVTMDYDDFDDSMSMTQRSLRTNIVRRLRSASWSAHETSTLISLWSEYIDQLRKARRTSKIFRELTHRLQTVYAIKRTPLEVKYKIANLSKEYRRRVRQFGPSNRSNWPYFDDVHRLLQSRPSLEMGDESFADPSQGHTSQIYSSLNQASQQDDILETEFIIPNESSEISDKDLDDASFGQSSSEMVVYMPGSGNSNQNPSLDQDSKPIDDNFQGHPPTNKNIQSDYGSASVMTTISQSCPSNASNQTSVSGNSGLRSQGASSSANPTVSRTRENISVRSPLTFQRDTTGSSGQRNPSAVPSHGVSNVTGHSIKELVQLRKESIRMTDKYRSEKLVLLKEQLHLQRESNVLLQRMLHVLEKLSDRRE